MEVRNTEVTDSSIVSLIFFFIIIVESQTRCETLSVAPDWFILRLGVLETAGTGGGG